MKKLLIFTILIGMTTIQPGETKNQISSKWLQDLGLRNTQWLNENQLILQVDTKNAQALMRELLAEKMRQGIQPWPASSEQTLAQLQTVISYPELKQAMHHPSEQSDLGRMVKNYQRLNSTSSLSLLQEQLSLCQRMQNMTCQADMHYRLGLEPSLPESERLGHFKIGASIGLTGGHKALGFLNQLMLIQKSEPYDAKYILQALLKETRFWKTPQVEAMILLAQANLSWEINDDIEQASKLFEQARELWEAPAFHAQIFYDLGRMQIKNREDGEGRINLSRALSLLKEPDSTRLQIQILDHLSKSYISVSAHEHAIPHLKKLLTLQPNETPEHYTTYIRLAGSIYSQNTTEGLQMYRQIQQKLTQKSVKDYWKQYRELAWFISGSKQNEQASGLIYPLLKNTNIEVFYRSELLLTPYPNITKQRARWALELMTSDEQVMRAAAVRTLREIQPVELLSELKPMLKSQDYRLRTNVIPILWDMLGRDILSEIAPMINDESWNVRQNAFGVLALGDYKLPLESIEKGISDPESKVQENALKLLKSNQEGQSKLIYIALDEKNSLKYNARSIISEVDITEKNLETLFLGLYDNKPDVQNTAFSLLSNAKYRVHWPTLVMRITRNPTQSEHALKLLASWNQADAVRQLHKLALHPDERVRKNYLRLFATSSMLSKDTDILKPLLKQEQVPMLKLEVISILSKFNIPEAWAALDEILKNPNKHQAYFTLHSSVNTRPACLSPTVFLTSKNWLKINRENFLHTWFYQSNKELIWNGQQCVPFTKLSKQEQESITQALLELTNAPNQNIRAYAQHYLKAWPTPDKP